MALSQTATFTGLTVAQYRTNQASYEGGYGRQLGIWNDAAKTYHTDCSMSSLPTAAARRSNTQAQFNALVAAARVGAAQSAASGMSPAALQTAIQTVATQLGATIPAPVISSISSATCVGTNCNTGGDDGLSGGAIAGIVVGSAVALLLIIAGVYYATSGSAASSAPAGANKAPASANGNGAPGGTEFTEMNASSSATDPRQASVPETQVMTVLKAFMINGQ